MGMKKLAANVSAAAVAAQAAVAMDKTPFVAGKDKVNWRVDFQGAVTTAVVKIQGAGSDLVYVDIATVTPASTSEVQGECLLYPNMRANMTTAGGAGTYSVTLFD